MEDNKLEKPTDPVAPGTSSGGELSEADKALAELGYTPVSRTPSPCVRGADAADPGFVITPPLRGT